MIIAGILTEDAFMTRRKSKQQTQSLTR